MTNHVTTQTLYIDLEGSKYITEEAAKEANHDIELLIRKYLEECLITFPDGKLDRLSTTKALWEKLEFTQEWIYDTYNKEEQ